MSVFILKLLVLLAPFLPDSEKWQRIDTEQHISFLFPNNSQHLKKSSDGIESNIYQTKDLTCVFGVVCSDFSAKGITLDKENAQLLYEQMRGSSVSMETAVLKDEKTVPDENMLVKEIEYTIVKDRYEMTYYKRFIFRDSYVYQISIGGRTRHLDRINEEKEVFFNSVNFH